MKLFENKKNKNTNTDDIEDSNFDSESQALKESESSKNVKDSKSDTETEDLKDSTTIKELEQNSSSKEQLFNENQDSSKDEPSEDDIKKVQDENDEEKKNSIATKLSIINDNKEEESSQNEQPSELELFSREDNHYNHKFATLRKRKWRMIILASCCCLLLLMIGVGSAWGVSILNAPFVEDENINNLVATENFDDPFYMLVVGTDTREEEGQYQLSDGRSDSCMLVRIDPNAYVVSVISIPRDTKITYKGQTEKFNAAFNNGGIKATIDVVNKMFGIEISHYAEISFNGLIDLVDAVGGIEVDVPEAINDEKAWTAVPGGHQILNGDQALAFSRSRDFADGDFTRTADQRILMDAIIHQGFKMDILQLPTILQTAKKYIKTDLSLIQMYSLAMQFRNSEQLTIYTSMVPSTTGSINGASYCFTDTDALDRMVKLIEGNENPNFVEITSGATICSSRDQAEIDANRNAHFQEHPECPGKASNSSSTKKQNSITDSYTNSYSSNY